VGTCQSTIRPAAILRTLATFEVRYDCPVVFEADPTAGARRVESWAWYAAREAVETVNALFRGTMVDPAGACRETIGTKTEPANLHRWRRVRFAQ